MKNRLTKHIKLLFIVTLLFISHYGVAQHILKKRISVSFSDATYSQALEIIGKLAKVDFFYSNDYLPQETISMNYQDSTLQSVLEYLFKDTNLSYRISGNEIIIKHNPFASKKAPNFYY